MTSSTRWVVHRGTGTFFAVDDDVVILEASSMTNDELDTLDTSGGIPYSACGRGASLADIVDYYCGGRKDSIRPA